MGYWSTHPMGGDTPLDHKSNLDAVLFTKEECSNYDLVMNKKEYKKRLSQKLHEATKIDFTREANFYDFTNAKIEENELENGKMEMTVENLGITPYTEDCSFVVPFLVVEYEIQISDELLSKKIKNMIGDGGAWQREYLIPKKSSEDYPTYKNNWNNLQSPFDHARKLDDLWYGLMMDEIPFEEIEKEEGLGSALKKAFEDNDGNYPGIINKK